MSEFGQTLSAIPFAIAWIHRIEVNGSMKSSMYGVEFFARQPKAGRKVRTKIFEDDEL